VRPHHKHPRRRGGHGKGHGRHPHHRGPKPKFEDKEWFDVDDVEEMTEEERLDLLEWLEESELF